MDSAIIFLSNRTEFDFMKRNDKYAEFFGARELQEIFFSIGHKRIMKEDLLSDWVMKKLPKSLLGDTKAYLIDQDFANEIEKEVNNQALGLDYSPLKLIKDMLSNSANWALIYLKQWDTVDEVYPLDMEGAMGALSKSIDWKSENFGFIAYKKI